MRRWMAALALAVVVVPSSASADLRVETATRKVIASDALPAPPTELPRIAQLPAGVDVDIAYLSVQVGEDEVRHAFGELWWVATIGDHVVVGHAEEPGGQADHVFAIDRATGNVAWRRKLDSMFATALAGNLLAIERAGTLDVIDVRDGKTLDMIGIAGSGIRSISRGRHAVHVKTSHELVAIERASGRVRWVRPTASSSNVAVIEDAVVDAWVDRYEHRYGVVTYDPDTGRRLETIDLGPTGGWYDMERVEISADAADEVVVSSLFATEDDGYVDI